MGQPKWLVHKRGGILSWMNTEAKSGRAENEQETRLTGLSVPGELFLWGSDVSHMKISGFSPSSGGNAKG